MSKSESQRLHEHLDEAENKILEIERKDAEATELEAQRVKRQEQVCGQRGIVLGPHRDEVKCSGTRAGLCVVFGLLDGGLGLGMRPKKGCVLKMGLAFLALYSKFHFCWRNFFPVLGGWVVWLGGGVRQITPPPPRSQRVDVTSCNGGRPPLSHYALIMGPARCPWPFCRRLRSCSRSSLTPARGLRPARRKWS